MPAPDATRALLQFIDASPTPFHATAEAARRLEQSGFTRLREEEAWSLAPGARRYVTRNGSTLIAFVVGTGAPAEHGFRLVGAHTDSPNLRLKPQPEVSKDGYRQLGVEVYGGVLLHTWFDRDLSLAGRVFVAGDGEPRLLKLDRAVARVPSLAIHLNREVTEKGFLVNKQTQLPPVVGLEPPAKEGAKPDARPTWLREALGQALGVSADAIEGFDLMLHDVTPSIVSGLAGDLIHAPRLDNLGSCHAALEALCAAAGTPCAATRAIALYDNEEVGSESAEGAASPFLAAALERVSLQCGDGSREDLHRAFARSHFVSADMAHAVHPHHADKHEPQHMPRLNAGPVVKVNCNLRYATNGATQARFERLCREADVPFQRFVSRTDLACGTTIGPITAARLGIPTVDVGSPMLSMHSIRELAGSQDHPLMVRALTRHFG